MPRRYNAAHIARPERLLMMEEVAERSFLSITNHEASNSMWVGGRQVTEANGREIEAGKDLVYRGQEAESAVYMICGAGLTVANRTEEIR